MRVVHVRHAQCTHYIGRRTAYNNPKHGIYANLGNPFHLRDGHSRQDVIAAFEVYARRTPEVMQRIKALPREAVLGCWCKPFACHGDAIVKLWKEMHNEL